MQPSEFVYSLSYAIGFNWPLIACLAVMIIYKDPFSKVLNIAISALQNFRLLSNEKPSHQDSSNELLALPVVAEDSQWDVYETPAYLRKQKFLSF